MTKALLLGTSVFGSLIAFAVPLHAESSITMEEATAAEGCDERLILCFNADGLLLPGESSSTLSSGDKVVVKVLGVRSSATYAIETTTSARKDTTLQPQNDAAANDVIVLAESSATIGDGDEFSVYVTASDNNTTTKQQVATFLLSDGNYFARPGVSFYWTNNGDRQIVDSTVMTKTAFVPAVSLTMWPWRHRKNSLGFLDHPSWDRSFAELFGVQIGTGLDFSNPFDRLFVGVTLEPISGVGFSFGGMMISGRYFSGVAGNSSSSTEEDLTLQLSFGVSLTTEVFDSMKTVANSRSK